MGQTLPRGLETMATRLFRCSLGMNCCTILAGISIFSIESGGSTLMNCGLREASLLLVVASASGGGAPSSRRQQLESNALRVSTPRPRCRRTSSHPAPTPHAAANSGHPRPRNAPSPSCPTSTVQTLTLPPDGPTTRASLAPISPASSSGMRRLSQENGSSTRRSLAWAAPGLPDDAMAGDVRGRRWQGSATPAAPASSRE
uniref:Uncharacterized protein n=1 Tax=Arundo donax TaxID=35708 RepID=A0A0A9DVA4_ARUDO